LYYKQLSGEYQHFQEDFLMDEKNLKMVSVSS